MNYITGTPRDQLVMYSQCFDEIIGKDNYVRFIDMYVNTLKLVELGITLPELRTGAPPFNPSLFLKIYMYCYLEHLRSSRKIEKECKRNQELIWLTCNLAPDFKTISDFRKNNSKALKNIFKVFLKFCYEHGLLDMKVTATDGTKMRAQNSRNEVYNRKTIEAVQKKIEENIEDYLNQLEENDKSEDQEVALNEEKVNLLAKRVAKLQKRSEKVSKIQELFTSDETLTQHYATDPDSRFQSDKGQKAPGYNAQICVDDKNKLIIANRITNEPNDYKQMTPMVEEIQTIKDELKIEVETKNIMDAGYDSEQEIMKNKDAEGVEILVQNKKDAKKNNKKCRTAEDPSSESIFEVDAFTYDKENDVYICPEGRTLEFVYNRREESGRQTRTFQCKNCDGCAQRAACTNNKQGRTISPSANKAVMDEYYESMKSKENKKILSKRKEIVEHPFGTLKRNWNFGYFMQKGKEKVEAEFSFMCFTYNLKRVLTMIPISNLLQALKNG